MPQGPLDHITIVDLTHVLAGPFATMQLADLGAKVIKVEPPGKGETGRHTPPLRGSMSHFFAAVNRNKYSVSIDLKSSDGVKLLKKLVSRADVFIHNFRPGVMDALGLGHKTLQEEDPKLIYCEISGFGQSGALSLRPAFDVNLQAIGGVMAMTGEPGGAPVRAGISVADLGAGMFAAFSILAALTNREKTGKGELIDVAMFDCIFNLLTYNITYQQETGREPTRSGGRHPSIVPMGCFTTKNGFIVLAAFNQKFWRRLCEAINRIPWIEDPRYKRMADRAKNQVQLFKELDEVISEKNNAEWESIFASSDVPFGPVYGIGDLMKHPQVPARRLLDKLKPVCNSDTREWQVGVRPVKYATFDTGIYKEPPRLGEDTILILREHLGLSSDQVSDLSKRGVIGIDSTQAKS